MEETNRTNYLASLHQQILSTIDQSGAQVYTMDTDTKGKRTIWRMLAAASIIAIVAITAIIFFTNKKLPVSSVAVTPTDIKAPENNRAVITHADGRN